MVCDERIIGIPHQTANILTMKGWNFVFVVLGFLDIKDDLELKINQNIFTKGTHGEHKVVKVKVFKRGIVVQIV